MSHVHQKHRLSWVSCLILLSSVAVFGSESNSERPNVAKQASNQSPDFLFGRPQTTIGIRGGWHRAHTDSEIFNFTTDLLSLQKSDFSGTGIIVDVGFPLRNRLDVLIAVEYNRASALSEYRDFVEEGDLPIEQATTFGQVNVNGNLELALLSRGRAIGTHAWVPSKFIPYVGGGGGLLRYWFEQEGHFVDFFDLSIFTDTLTSTNWTLSTNVFAGIDVKVNRRFSISVEARYLWAQSELTQDFVGFDSINLSGLSITSGVQVGF
jgi:hypothetical protein